MIPCLLSLGSNLKNPQRQLTLAIQRIKRLPHTHLLKTAPYYRNPAWGKKNLPDYYNTVLLLQTRLTPFCLLRLCQTIEQKQQRIRRVRYAARTLDIDILQFGSLSLCHPALQLPHPRMYERDFVLIPLNSIRKADRNKTTL